MEISDEEAREFEMMRKAFPKIKASLKIMTKSMVILGDYIVSTLPDDEKEPLLSKVNELRADLETD